MILGSTLAARSRRRARGAARRTRPPRGRSRGRPGRRRRRGRAGTGPGSRPGGWGPPGWRPGIAAPPRPASTARAAGATGRARHLVGASARPLQEHPPAPARTSRGRGSGSRSTSPAGPAPAPRAEAALQRGTSASRAVRPARDVVADVRDRRRPRGDREQRVERRHPVRLGRRDPEPGAHMPERPGADPPDRVHHRVEDRQEQVPPGPRRIAAERDVPVGHDGVDGAPFGVGVRGVGQQPQVRRRTAPLSLPSRDHDPATEPRVQEGPVSARPASASPLPGRSRELLDPDRRRLELGRARLRVPGLVGDQVDRRPARGSAA